MMKKLRNAIKNKLSTGKYLKYFAAKHRPARGHLKKLSITLALSFCLLMSGCGGALNTIIAAFDYGPTAVQRFPQLSQAERDRISRGCTREAALLRAYKATPKEQRSEAKKVLIAETLSNINDNFNPVADSKAQVWINDILTFVRLFLGLPPSGGAISAAEVQAVAESDAEIRVSDEDAERFEKLMKGK